MAGTVGFVGRERELSRLLVALRSDTRLVVVTGDAGVGKTRFVEEGLVRAASAGVVTTRGECLPLTAALPLLPIATALDELARVDGGGLLEGALNAAPGYVRGEVARLLPGLGSDGGPGAEGREEGWRRERLFSAVEELLDAAAAKSGCRIGLVVEDVHWADGETLDCLTFLTRARRRAAASVVVTCRGDEVPVADRVAEWLAQVRALAGAEEIRLGPLSRAEVAGLAGGPARPEVVDELYARAEGNPFFTEQLVAAAAVDADGGLRLPPGLPERLAELLAARAGRCTGQARAVLAGLAVAGRALDEEVLRGVTGLGAEVVRDGLRELAQTRLLAEDTGRGTHRLRHALLAEAVAGRLLPGERAALHEQAARALAAAGGGTLAAEVAGHWQAAGCPGDELSARIAAAAEAERVFGFAEAAAHLQRAIELSDALPAAGGAGGSGLPGLYLRAIDALLCCGDYERAEAVTEQACLRFADHPDPAIAADVRHRAAYRRGIDGAAAGLPLIEEAQRRYEQAPPSAGHAEAWLNYALLLRSAGGGAQEIADALRRAEEIAETAGAAALVPKVLTQAATCAFLGGQVKEGFAVLRRGWALAEAAQDGTTLVWLALTESDALLRLARFQPAADVASQGLARARRAGLQDSWWAAVLAAAAARALLARGRTAEAAALVDPLTAGPPDLGHWPVHQARAEIDLLRGDAGAAARRRQLVEAIPAHLGRVDHARESVLGAAELALWAGHPADALERIQRVLPLFTTAELAISCGRLLAAGMRACADLADTARAHRDGPAAAAAAAGAGALAAWADQVRGAPFADHPFAATIPAERATWAAERTRLAGAGDPEAWSAAATAWQDLGCPHRAGYGWWRRAQAQLDSGQPASAAAAALRAAATAGEGHAPLLAQVRGLAQRARISLQAEAAAIAESPRPAEAAPPYELTARELAVLRLLAAGRTNAQIGAELYISPKTASVHVTNILRKLGVAGRVQAAALAERAGLLPGGRG